MIKPLIKLYLWAENIWFKLPQKLRFLLVGGFNTVFAYSILALIYWLFASINANSELGFSQVIVANAALFVQYVISINVSFLTMRYYVFHSRENWKREFIKAWSVYLFLYLINSPILSFLMLFVGLFITMGIGTSFGTIPILAVLYIPICLKLGFSIPSMIIVLSAAAALGDAGSPASDTTLGPTAGLNADGQHNHVWDTCIPTFLHYNIPLFFAAIIAVLIFH